ncbi:hypothetical protein JRO89_XS10G0145800 [Xanthoceras sorbifolium]|uniref:Two-component response regulator-like PRR37 n=1 Tax=Xanthoceras sorbifolium TaxID=99658 RepID=A0ABQ8HIQ6_9ROSI|nr:hypothetical protein JRO89_XS10G0145800 [Xanthoceras sorbifolium]
MCYEQKEVRNGVAGEGQGLVSSEEDESRVDDAAVNADSVPVGTIQVHEGFQISQQQQPQGSMIHWERFLPIRSLKVLLVENDDSTRHVVSALLRNCSYEGILWMPMIITAVANGLQAWRILEDLTNHIDIVLTEVVMPVLSGIGLLYKIMKHKMLKSIPVIMMSSQDSMGIVFKCLSKGAVDFLVKPIRKNELKNLWQHVWRRCHSSSWTKKAVEIDSPQPISPSYKLVDAPDSISVQAIYSKPESFSNGWVHVTETKDGHDQDEQLDDVAMGKDLEIGMSKTTDLQRECQHEKLPTHQTSKRQSKFPEVDSKPFNSEQLECDNENKHGKWRDQVPNTIGAKANANPTNPQAESRDFDAPNIPSDISRVKDKASCDSGDMPSLELTLKRLRGAEDDRSAANDDCNVLRHSGFSAFSKYNTATSANQAPTGNVGSCSPLDNSSVVMKTETMQNFPSRSNGTLPNQQSNGSSNNNDMASTAKYVTCKPEALNDKSESMSAFKPFHSSAFQSLQNGRISLSQPMLHEKADGMGVTQVQAQSRGSHHPVQVQTIHHHHHHYHQCNHNMQQHQSQEHDELSLKNMAAAAQQCGSSNVFEGSADGNVGNYSVNGSASGSNHGSNGQNGSSTALNAGVTNLESDNGAAGTSGVGVHERIRGNMVDEGWVAQREAALTKFRQKRKERCFGKKVIHFRNFAFAWELKIGYYLRIVRYQSRKKLAEQRPRVKGQFVRQIVYDSESDSRSRKDSASNDHTSENNSCDDKR